MVTILPEQEIKNKIKINIFSSFFENIDMPKILLLFLLLYTKLIYGEWIENIQGEYVFGPATTQNKACSEAYNNAIKSALIKKSGITINYFDHEKCSERINDQYNDYTCTNNQIFMSRISGEIIEIKNKKTILKDETNSDRRCIVRMSVKINDDISENDPSFNFSLKTNNKNIFQNCSKINFLVSPTQSMYFTIFFYESDSELLKKIYPNKYDSLFTSIKKENYLRNENTDFLAVNKTDRVISGSFIVLATKQKVKFNDYFENYEEFIKILGEIPKSKRRLLVRPYFIYPNSNKCS